MESSGGKWGAGWGLGFSIISKQQGVLGNIRGARSDLRFGMTTLTSTHMVYSLNLWSSGWVSVYTSDPLLLPVGCFQIHTMVCHEAHCSLHTKPLTLVSRIRVVCFQGSPVRLQTHHDFRIDCELLTPGFHLLSAATVGLQHCS